MKHIEILAGLILTTCAASVHGVSMRRIYTLFTDRKTWNEARQICADQFGQLVKINGDKEQYELTYLSQYAWGNNFSAPLISGESFWSGLHRPLANSTDVKFQDCESFVPSVPITTVDNQTCGSYDRRFELSMSPCDERKIFICERYEGDCWYQPVLNKQPAVTTPSVFQRTDLSAIECAVLCRNHNETAGSECWAFLYLNDVTGTTLYCRFYSFNDAYVLTSGAVRTPTSASAFYSYEDNRVDIPASTVDFIFYVRKCFEGSLDLSEYSQYVDDGFFAETECATITTTISTNTSDVCFCTTDEQPPIPKPISSEAKAEELIKELTIQPSNTSAAQRKKTSAEDNRTSAISVGYVGVGLMVGVFGCLFIMDMGRLAQIFKGILNLIKATRSSAYNTERTESTADDIKPPESTALDFNPTESNA